MVTHTYVDEKDKGTVGSAFTLINWTEDYDLDCNGAVDVVADTLGTLIRELIRQGILKGTVATA